MRFLSRLSRKEQYISLGVVFVLTTISIFAFNPYEYGLSDHAITIPFLKSIANPSLYPNDYLVAEKSYYYSYFWQALGFIGRYFPLNIPLLFFVLYYVSLFFFFWGIYLIAKLIFQKQEVAYLSLFFLLFFKPTLGGMSTFDRAFLTRVAVLPILVFAFYFFLKKKFLWSFVLQGLGFLMHPLSAAHMIAILFLASIIWIREMGWKRLLVYLIILASMASPIFIWKIISSPPSVSLLHANADWLELLRLRSADEIFPFSWSRVVFLEAGLVFLAFLASWKYKPQAQYHRIIIGAAFLIIGFCILGTIFSEIYSFPLALNLQLFRSFQWLVYLAFIYFANYVFQELRSGRGLCKLSAVLLALGIFYGASNWVYGYAAFLILALLLVLKKRGTDSKLPRYFVHALLAVVLILGSIFYFQGERFSWGNHQEKFWLDVAKKAKAETGQRDVFIVPPHLEGFRIESERTIYGDWKDGTLTFYNPAFGKEWLMRMQRLGYQRDVPLKESFFVLSEADFRAIAKETRQRAGEKSRVFLVTFRNGKQLNFPLAYGNEKFLVYEIK
ncbi:MAG: hypothetical protein PHW01_03225 [Patescibacteria group bacterium]|nr:hypothetical protein [Patescibacteria group bacterium]